MAVVRQARSAPPYGLIAFVFLWFISTAVAVIFYLQVAKTDADRGEAVKKQKDVAAQLQKANEDISQLKSIVSQSTSAAVADIRQDAVAASEKAKKAGVPLISAVSDLADEKTNADNNALHLQSRITDIQNTYDNNVKAIQADRDGLSKTIDTLKSQSKDLSDQLAAAQDASKTAIDSSQKQLTDLQAKSEADIRDKLVQIQQVKDDSDKKQQKIDELTKIVESIRPHVTGDLASIVDGHIIQTFPGQDTVYLDLGRRDRVSVGLNFEIYDRNKGVGSNQSRGKGSLQIIEVGDVQSLARITHTEPYQTILKDDVVGNLAYHRDRTRTYRFYVAGEFSLNGDGVYSPADREKVKRMITSSGGVVEDSLNTQTDFVVLGASPTAAQALYDATTDQGKELIAQREKEIHKYNDLVVEAKALSVPILNENRFLALMGYFNTTDVSQPLYSTNK